MEQATALERSSSPAISERTHVGESFTKLLWVFLLMSVVGLIGETLQHYLVFNEWESRPGFIWGPFSPIYGTAAVLLTLILEPLQKKNALVLIAIGAIVGGGLEYFASWAMETFGGIVAWSYLNNPFNFDGRTDLFHALVWGTLGMLWVKIGLLLCEKGFSYLNLKSKLSRFVTVALSVFLVLNIIMTICVLVRTDDRASGIPPQNAFEQYIDYAYPTEMLQKRFHNMGGLGM